MMTNPCKKDHDIGLEITVTIKSNFHNETSQIGNSYAPTAQL